MTTWVIYTTWAEICWENIENKKYMDSPDHVDVEHANMDKSVEKINKLFCYTQTLSILMVYDTENAFNS